MPARRSHPVIPQPPSASRNGTPTTSDRPAPPDPARPAVPRDGPPVRRTRAGAAWVGMAVAGLVLVPLIVFMLQNTAPVEVQFLGLRGSAPLALTLLIAGVGVGFVALVVGTVRITQLRHRIDADRRPAARGGAGR